MDHARIITANLDSPRREPSNSGLGFVVALTFFSGIDFYLPTTYIVIQIARQVNTHETLISQTKKGLRQIRDHVQKALSEKNPDLPGIFLCDPLLTSLFNVTSQITSEQKYTR